MAETRGTAPIALADADDRWIVATAVDGRAEVLVNGDRGLLAAADAAPLPILSPRSFWERLRQGNRRPNA